MKQVFNNYGLGIQIGEVKGNVNINYNSDDKKIAQEVMKNIKESRDLQPTDCENCVYGEVMRPGTYKKGTTTIVNVSGSTTRCTKEKVSTMSFVDGDMVCGDYKERG